MRDRVLTLLISSVPYTSGIGSGSHLQSTTTNNIEDDGNNSSSNKSFNSGRELKRKFFFENFQVVMNYYSILSFGLILHSNSVVDCTPSSTHKRRVINSPTYHLIRVQQLLKIHFMNSKSQYHILVLTIKVTLRSIIRVFYNSGLS